MGTLGAVLVMLRDGNRMETNLIAQLCFSSCIHPIALRISILVDAGPCSARLCNHADNLLNTLRLIPIAHPTLASWTIMHDLMREQVAVDAKVAPADRTLKPSTRALALVTPPLTGGNLWK